MVTTIKQGFDQLRANTNITTLQESVVAERQRAVRNVLEQQVVVLDSFLMGSYRRSTLTAPLRTADVDVFLVLDPKYFNHTGKGALLAVLQQALRGTYSTSKIRPDGQAVTISFSDFGMDVVPGFHRAGGGYLIPDPRLQGWISTNPKTHIDVWAKENHTHNGNLIPLLKMLKSWNINNGGLLRSFHLETMVLQILRGVTITSFSSGVRYAFDEARMRVSTTTPDEAGYDDDVGAYLRGTSALYTVTRAIEDAYARASRAEQLEAGGSTREAFGQWRLIFGDYFPAYG